MNAPFWGVNNAVNQYYLEHSRHVLMSIAGIDVAKLHDEGTDLIVSRVEFDHRLPLRSRYRLWSAATCTTRDF